VGSTLDLKRLSNILESLLFVTKKPLTLEELCELTGEGPEVIDEALNGISDGLEAAQRGIRMVKVAHGYAFGTDPANAEFVDKLSHSRIETTLSPQSLESLAIIAYKQPITKAELEMIRGVYCDGVIETLQAKKLIEEKGRSRALGRPILYGTTDEFLRHFGLKDINDLPALPEDVADQQGAFSNLLHEEAGEEAVPAAL